MTGVEAALGNDATACKATPIKGWIEFEVLEAIFFVVVFFVVLFDILRKYIPRGGPQ